jgi:glycosyltransferase involved in cell wall biosynthesis
MAPHNIVHILGTSEPEGSSIAKIVASLSQSLDPRRYKLFAWFCRDHGPLITMLEEKGVSVEVIEWRGGRRDIFGLWRLSRAMRIQKFDIAHQHFGGRSFRLISRHIGRAQTILHLHGRAAEEDWNAPLRCNTAGADLVIATSEAVAKWSGVNAEVVYPGIAVPAGLPEAATGRQDRAPVLGAAGRLVPMKGFKYLIRALPVIQASVPDVALEIAGSGPEEVALKEEARRIGVGGHVRFLGWLREIPFNHWDVFVMPSVEEPFGMVALEAMASGRPVVASAVGGLPELVEDGNTGRLVPPAEPQALSTALISLLRNSDERQKMGVAARRRAHHFSEQRMCESIERLYRHLLE